MSLEVCKSPLEVEGQNYIWFGITKDGRSIYECDDEWETKDFTTDIYEARYFINTLGLLGNGCLFTMDLDILDKEDIESNMFAYHIMYGKRIGFELPKIYLAHSTYPVEVRALTSPNMTISNPKDDIFVRKYVHCDMKLSRSQQETTAQSLIDFYALGYANNLEINGITIQYAIMLCVPNDNNGKLFYKLQLMSNHDINIDLYASNYIFCSTDPHKTIELKKDQRVEFDYRLE